MIIPFYFLLLCLSMITGLNSKKIRIIGGTEVTDNEYPYFVQVINSYYSDFLCGGTLISKNGVITVAKCIQVPQRFLKINVGSVYFDGGDEYDVRDVCVYTFHEYFQLGIVFSWKSIKLGPTVAIMDKLAHEGFDYYAIPIVGTIAGFGRRSSLMKPSKRLAHLAVRIISYDHCRTSFQDNDVGPYSFCTVPDDEFSDYDACTGDLGGPMIYNNTLIGVIQDDSACYKLGHATVYTKVGSYYEWIRQTLDVHCETFEDGIPRDFVDVRKGKLMQSEKSVYAFPFCIAPCSYNSSTGTSSNSCIFHPIDTFNILITMNCLELYLSNHVLNDNNTVLQIQFENQLLNVTQIIKGFDVTYENNSSSFDKAILRLSNSLGLPNNYKKIKFYNNKKDVLPYEGLLTKYQQTEDPGRVTEITVSVFNVPPQACMKYAADVVPPFNLTEDMFCVIPSLVKGQDEFNLCSALKGAAVYSSKKRLIGLVVWEKGCADLKPIIASRALKLMSTYSKVFNEN